ncbi:MAG TPA: glycine--tRNA ligase [Candidatus Kapabacteria bacterium]|nr:glycine--tRNA ligase [Candidatus Kapabacteria bacterium]HPO63615.1 glycine--tRNA ligase [Candidatus Kapabacteria bacterium]
MYKLETIISLAKHRGFVFQSSEIYGGLNGCWDFGPLGVELLRNIKEEWWREMTFRDEIVGVDAAILMHPRTWEASGHIAQFTDPMIDNKTSKQRYRADNLIEEYIDKLLKKNKKDEAEKIRLQLENVETNEDYFKIISENGITDPVSGSTDWTEVRNFNLMFKTFVGPVEDVSNTVYLRPESAQGIFVNFKNVMDSARQKVPFGIAQIGKAFRNEINTKNFLFRTREFEQMEMQFFIKPGSEKKWFDYWRNERINWYINLGISKDKLNFKEHQKLAHYANFATDIEFEFPFGFGEIEGIHSRTDFDLKSHQEFSGKKMEYVDTVNQDRFVPYVIETSGGVTRSFMAFLCNAYCEEDVKGDNDKVEKRTVLRFHKKLAPITAAVFPLVNKDGMPEVAHKIYKDLQKEFRVQYDTSGAVGRRYRRQDEIGTPYCITVDGQTLQDETVTVRERDSMEQIRISNSQVAAYISKQLKNN